MADNFTVKKSSFFKLVLDLGRLYASLHGRLLFRQPSPLKASSVSSERELSFKLQVLGSLLVSELRQSDKRCRGFWVRRLKRPQDVLVVDIPKYPDATFPPGKTDSTSSASIMFNCNCFSNSDFYKFIAKISKEGKYRFNIKNTYSIIFFEHIND